MTIFDGDIYFARSETGHYKIGISKNARERIKHFNTIMPIGVELIRSIPSDNCREGEAKLHEFYKRYRYRGEWFDFPKDVAAGLYHYTAYFEGEFHVKMEYEEWYLFEKLRDGELVYTEAELPY